MPTRELKKVLHVIHSLNTGGAEQVVKNYALQLNRPRFQVAVCALTGGGDIVTELRRAGIPVHLLGKSGRWDLSVWRKLRCVIRAEAPSLIHVHDDMSNNWTALALGRGQRVPIIRTIHKIYAPDSSLYFRMHQQLSRRLYRRNAYLICCSEAVRRSMRLPATADEKLVTIHNGIDWCQFNHAQDVEPNGSLSGVGDKTTAGFSIGTIGSLRTEKGHEYLLRAAQILKKEALPLHFYLVGDGDKRLYLEQLAHRLEIQNQVHFLGYRRDVRTVLEEFDLVVFPSITEGLPMAMLEALAMKKPVIASAIGGIPEVIQHGETGWLVPPADPAALAHAITAALHQPVTRQRLAARGFQRVAAEFTTEIMVRQTERIYESALAQNGLARKSANRVNSFQSLRVLLVTMFPNPQKKVPANQTALLADYLEREGAQVLRTTRETRRGFKTLKIIAAMLRYVRQYDIVQIQTTPSVGFINTAVVIGVGKLLGKKVVSNYFTSAGPEFLERFRRVAVPILNCADGVVAASRYVRDRLQAFGLRVTCIPHLLDFNQRRFKPRPVCGPRLIWVKRFDPEAGPENMLSAFQILKQREPSARLVMIGEGPLRQACRQFVQEQRLADVQFPGFVSRENLPVYYNAADIFVLTSKNDNQPMAVLEAMACGLPIVAPKVGGLPDVIEDGISGMLVENNNPHAIAEGIQFLLQNQKRAQQMAEAAFCKLERHRWEHLRQVWLDFYGTLFEPHHDP